jgi:enoyl-CoA hydratase/carnithine racemase
MILTSLAGRDEDGLGEQTLQISSEVSTLLGVQKITKPTIAAVNGPARGGGLSLAAACHLRIAEVGATFGIPLGSLGFSGGVGGLSWTLPRIIGSARAAELMYTGRAMGAREALEIGLVSKVTEPEDLVPEAIRLGAAIAAHDAVALQMTKRALNSAAALSLSDAVAVETAIQALAIASRRDQNRQAPNEQG